MDRKKAQHLLCHIFPETDSFDNFFLGPIYPQTFSLNNFNVPALTDFSHNFIRNPQLKLMSDNVI